MLKVLLIVVQGKPEGKTIPISIPVFRIGRGEDCHLRPNSDEVSRRHAEIAIGDSEVTIRDLGSRNGTRINGKPLTGLHKLKSGELVQIGPLTFAVAIQGVPTAASPSKAPSAPSAAAAKPDPSSLDDVPQEEIEAWLVSDSSRPTPDRPSGVYDGDTITIEAYREAHTSSPKAPSEAAAAPKAEPKPEPAPKASPKPEPVAEKPAQPVSEKPAAKPEPEPELEPEPEVEAEQIGMSPDKFAEALEGFEPPPEGAGDAPGLEASDEDSGLDGDDEEELAEATEVDEEEFIDESNPFYTAKKTVNAGAEASGSEKQTYKDTSDAANDILRRMLDQRRSSRSS